MSQATPPPVMPGLPAAPHGCNEEARAFLDAVRRSLLLRYPAGETPDEASVLAAALIFVGNVIETRGAIEAGAVRYLARLAKARGMSLQTFMFAVREIASGSFIDAEKRN